MTGANPQFWKQPIRFMRYVSHTKPHFVVAIGLGVAAPVAGYVLTPLRRKYMYADAPEIPFSYPRMFTNPLRGIDANPKTVPNRARETLTGYDD